MCFVHGCMRSFHKTDSKVKCLIFNQIDCNIYLCPLCFVSVRVSFSMSIFRLLSVLCSVSYASCWKGIKIGTESRWVLLIFRPVRRFLYRIVCCISKEIFNCLILTNIGTVFGSRNLTSTRSHDTQTLLLICCRLYVKRPLYLVATKQCVQYS